MARSLKRERITEILGTESIPEWSAVDPEGRVERLVAKVCKQYNIPHPGDPRFPRLRESEEDVY